MKIAPPLISVVLTTHMRPTLLRRALNSLVEQEFKDFEIIVCADEASRETLDTARLALRVQDSFLSAPYLKGPAETRNLGIKVASGRWICFLDDDDSFDRNYFNEASKLFDASDVIHYFNYTERKEARHDSQDERPLFLKKDIGNFSIDQLDLGNFIPINALFCPAHIAKANFFDGHLQSHEDWDWLISLKSQGYKYLHHENFGPNVHIDLSSSRNNDAINSGSRALDYLSIYRKWPGASEELREGRERQMESFGLPIPRFFL